MVGLSADVVSICVIRWIKASLMADLETKHGADFGPNKRSGPKTGRSILGILGDVMK